MKQKARDIKESFIEIKIAFLKKEIIHKFRLSLTQSGTQHVIPALLADIRGKGWWNLSPAIELKCM